MYRDKKFIDVPPLGSPLHGYQCGVPIGISVPSIHFQLKGKKMTDEKSSRRDIRQKELRKRVTECDEEID